MSAWHGCAMVASKYPQRQVAGDMFRYSALTIFNFGFSTPMSYANNGFDQDYDGETGFTPTPTSFKELLQTSAYQYLFGLGFPRHALQLWTFANGPVSNPPAIQVTYDQLQAEYTEVYDACVHLLQTYSNKEFIIKNWEGDWQLLNGYDPTQNPPGYRAERFVAFWGARQRAVRDATAATPSSSKIIYCLELNRCLDDYGYRLMNDVLPSLKPDMVGWSAYEAINYWVDGWQRVAAPTTFGSEDIRAVAGNGSSYVVVGTGGVINTSTDAQRFYPVTSSFSTSNINDVVWVPALSMYIACGASGKVATSPDGQTWTQQTTGTAQQLNGIVFNGTSVLVFGNSDTLLYSTTGTSWSAVSYVGGAPGTDYQAAYYDGSGVYIAGGTNGKLARGTTTSATSVTANFSTSTIRTCIGNGSIYVIGGEAGRICSSSDATSWAVRTSQFGADVVLDTAYGQGKFVAVGTTGKISTSTDGITWVARTAGTGAYLQAVQYSQTENVFAYGCDGATGYSRDGITWVVNGQGAMGGLNVNAMFSAPDFTATGADNGTLTIARFWHVQSAAEANIDFYIRKGVARIRKLCAPGTPVAITEYGWPQNQSNFTGLGLDVGGLIQAVLNVANTIGLVGVIYWQMFDNEEQSPGVPRGFSLYDRNANSTTPGALNGAGLKYQSILP